MNPKQNSNKEEMSLYHFQNLSQWQVSISILDLLTIVLLLLLFFFPVIFLPETLPSTLSLAIFQQEVKS